MNQIFCPPYEIVEELEAGKKYRAISPESGQVVAIRVVRVDRGSQPDAALLVRLQAWIDQMLGLSHPHIARLLDVKHGESEVFLISEWCDGSSIRDLIQSQQELAHPLIVYYMQQVAAGLDFLHSKGVCHRDFSLQRILIDPGGTAKVIDAGILGILPDELKQGGLSGSERGYISPEELLGKGPSEEADRYRFTVACFELVAGTIPFVGDSPMELREDILRGKITIPSARNRNLPRHLVKVFEKALSRDLADRPTTASHLIKPLSHTASHYTGLALAGNNPIEKKDVNPGRASRVPRALTVVGLGALFGIAILSSRLGRIVAPQQKAHSSLAVQQVFQPSSGDNNQNGGGNGAKGLVSGELLSIARRRTGAEDELIPALESILNGSPTSPVTAQQRELLSLATRHDNPAIRRFVVKVISSREVTELGGELLELLLDDSPTVRSAAIQALQTTLAPVPVSTLALRAAGESDPLIHSKIMELARALEVEGRLSKGHQR